MELSFYLLGPLAELRAMARDQRLRDCSFCPTRKRARHVTTHRPQETADGKPWLRQLFKEIVHK